MSANSPIPTDPDSHEEISRINAAKEQLNVLMEKIAGAEISREERRAALQAIKILEPGRKCFRLVKSVLVELTVETLIPDLEQEVKDTDRLHQDLCEKKEVLEIQYNSLVADMQKKENPHACVK